MNKYSETQQQQVVEIQNNQWEWEQEIIFLINNYISGQNPEEVQEIIIENTKLPKITPKIKRKIQKFSNLISLGINGCELEDISDLPHIEGLIRLELAHNKLKLDQLQYIYKYKNLQSLVLSGWPISELRQLQELPINNKNLLQLDIFGSELSKQKNYRDTLYTTFKNLKLVDNMSPGQTECFIPHNNLKLLELVAFTDSDSADESYNQHVEFEKEIIKELCDIQEEIDIQKQQEKQLEKETSNQARDNSLNNSTFCNEKIDEEMEQENLKNVEKESSKKNNSKNQKPWVKKKGGTTKRQDRKSSDENKTDEIDLIKKKIRKSSADKKSDKSESSKQAQKKVIQQQVRFEQEDQLQQQQKISQKHYSLRSSQQEANDEEKSSFQKKIITRSVGSTPKKQKIYN